MIEEATMDNVLVFAPHPDDDIIGCGGSIAHHVKIGDRVAIVYMTSGESGSLKYSSQELGSIREEEARQAAAVLGVTQLFYLRYPDGYLDYSKAALDDVVSLIRQLKPTWVYLPHENEAVPDHYITFRLAAEGIRRAAGTWFQASGLEPWQVSTVLAYEIWTPLSAVGFSQDISSYINLKLEALRMHRTQIEFIAYDRAVEGLNRYRGVMTGHGQHCECFQLIRAAI